MATYSDMQRKTEKYFLEEQYIPMFLPAIKKQIYHFWPTGERPMDDKLKAVFQMCFHR